MLDFKLGVVLHEVDRQLKSRYSEGICLEIELFQTSKPQRIMVRDVLRSAVMMGRVLIELLFADSRLNPKKNATLLDVINLSRRNKLKKSRP